MDTKGMSFFVTAKCLTRDHENQSQTQFDGIEVRSRVNCSVAQR